MAAYDNVQMPGSPAAASYGGPIVDFAPLGQLGDAYYKGQEQQRQQKIRNAFTEGLPKDAQGQPDYNAMASKLFQLGDFGNASNVLKTGYALKSLDAPTEPGPFGGGAPSAAGPGGSASPAAQPSMQPARVAPTTEPAADAVEPPGRTDNRGIPNLTSGNVIMGEPQNAPVQAAPQTQVAQAAPAGGDAAAGLVPPQFRANPRGYADTLSQAADRLRQQAQRQGMLGIPTKALEDRAAQYDAVANKVRDALAPTGEQKDLASGATRQKVIVESDTKRGENQYGGMVAAANQYERGAKPYVQLSKSILNQPETYTGIGANGVASLNRLKATFGDAKGAQYYEALQKVTAASVLSTINTQRDEMQESGANSSRIFSQQVDQVAKSTLSTDNTLAGNRFLIGVQERLGDYSIRLREMAAAYKKAHGTLDAGFDEQVSADLQKRPLFTPLEQQHPNLIGSPTSPFDDVKRTQAWAKKMGLNKGDPIRTPGGKIVAVP